MTGNESNPFVVDARVAHVPVHDDIEDNQEFNDMLSKILLDLQDDSSDVAESLIHVGK